MFKLTKLGSSLTRLQRSFSSAAQDWDTSHLLYRYRQVHHNVFFIQEKYFEFSWNLANMFFIKAKMDIEYLNLILIID